MEQPMQQVMEQLMTLTPPEEIRVDVERARVQVMIKSGFYSTLLLSAKMWYSRGYADITTLATDGADYYINLDYFASLDEEYQKSGIAHEVVHKAMLHVTRRGDRNPKLWNVAADVVTNGILAADGYRIKPSWVRDKELEDLPVEEIYRIMLDEPDRKVSGKSGKEWMKEDGGAPMHFVRGPATKEEARKIENDTMVLNAKALAEMKQEGKHSGSPICKHLEKILEPKVDWKSKLRDFVSDKGMDDWTFAKPHKNYMAHGIIMPNTTGTQIGRLLVAVDTSGSIFAYQSLVDQFSAEINSICEDTVPEALEVLYMDTEVRGHDTFEWGEEFKIDMKGGGGTAFKSTFDYINELDNPPVAVIVFTDMHVFDLNECECEIPTLWMQYGSGSKVVKEPPFGSVTPIDS